jgi:hypothetical protein
MEIVTALGIEESHSGMLKAMIKPFKMMKVMMSGFFNRNLLRIGR